VLPITIHLPDDVIVEFKLHLVNSKVSVILYCMIAQHIINSTLLAILDDIFVLYSKSLYSQPIMACNYEGYLCSNLYTGCCTLIPIQDDMIVM
jgi:hypothetical protein